MAKVGRFGKAPRFKGKITWFPEPIFSRPDPWRSLSDEYKQKCDPVRTDDLHPSECELLAMYHPPKDIFDIPPIAQLRQGHAFPETTSQHIGWPRGGNQDYIALLYNLQRWSRGRQDAVKTFNWPELHVGTHRGHVQVSRYEKVAY